MSLDFFDSQEDSIQYEGSPGPPNRDFTRVLPWSSYGDAASENQNYHNTGDVEFKRRVDEMNLATQIIQTKLIPGIDETQNPFRNFDDLQSRSIPDIDSTQDAPLYFSTEDRETFKKKWREARAAAIERDPSLESKLPITFEMRDVKEAEEAEQSDRDFAKRRAVQDEFPNLRAISEFIRRAGSGLTDSDNLLWLPAEVAIGGITGPLYRTIGLEVGLAGAQTILQAPGRARLAEFYGDKYGWDEFVNDFVTNAAIAAGIPIGFAGAGLAGRHLFRKIRSFRNLPTSAADELYDLARKAEISESSPFNLSNSLSVGERFARSFDAINRATQSFLRSEPLPNRNPIISARELDEFLDIPIDQLNTSQRQLRDELLEVRSNSGSPRTFADDSFLDDFPERATVETVDGDSITVKTSDGQILPVRLNRGDRRFLATNPLRVGDPTDIRRVKSVEEIPSGDPNVPSKITAREGAELAPFGDNRRSVADFVESSGNRIPEPDGMDGAPGKIDESFPTEGPPSSRATDSESLGHHPEPASLEFQEKVFNEKFSKENLENLMRQVDEIADDMNLSLDDGVLTSAKDMKRRLDLNSRQQKAFSECAIGE